MTSDSDEKIQLNCACALLTEVDVNSTDKDGSTPFLLASSRGQDEVIRILKRNGARSSDVDNNGLTALMLACANGFECAVRTLLSFENQAEVLELSSLAGVTPVSPFKPE